MHPDIQAYHQRQSPEDREVCELLAAELAAGLPEAEARVWHAHPVWFIEGNPIVGYSKLKGGVRLLFWSGQGFGEAGAGLVPTGKFKAAEARYPSKEDVDTEALARWLAASREVQWDYKNIVKRRGRLERLR